VIDFVLAQPVRDARGDGGVDVTTTYVLKCLYCTVPISALVSYSCSCWLLELLVIVRIRFLGLFLRFSFREKNNNIVLWLEGGSLHDLGT